MLNWSIRYAAAVRLVDAVPTPSVLDVGSGDHGLNTYRDSGFVVRTDIALRDRLTTPGPFLVADATRLPVRDRSMHTVLSLDLIEHLSPQQRRTAVSEMCRVAEHRVVVGFPVGLTARLADALLAALLTVLGRGWPDWLVEHRSFRYPTVAGLRAAVPDGWQLQRIARNDNAFLHTVVVLADGVPGLRRVADRLGARLVRRGTPRWVDWSPAYRRLFVLEPVVEARQSRRWASVSSATG